MTETCRGLSSPYCILLIAVALLTAGCAQRTPLLQPGNPAASAPAYVELKETPFISQQRYQCGPAALGMLLQQSGVAVDAEDLVPQVYLPQRKGSLQIEILAASRRYNRVPYLIEPTLEALTTALQAGHPVLVLQNLGLRSRPSWHYAVVIGYRREDDSIILRSGTDARQRLPAWLFLKTWQDGGNWGLVTLRPGQLPAFADRRRYLAAVAAMEGIADADAVLAAYRSALDRWPQDTTALFGMANTLHRQQEFDEAGRIYRQILAMQPRHIAAMNNLAQVYADAGCYGEADAVIRAALSISNEDDTHYAALINTYARIQQHRDPAAKPCTSAH